VDTSQGAIINQFGDDMEQFCWDGPVDSDEEVAEMLPLKNEYEK